MCVCVYIYVYVYVHVHVHVHVHAYAYAYVYVYVYVYVCVYIYIIYTLYSESIGERGNLAAARVIESLPCVTSATGSRTHISETESDGSLVEVFLQEERMQPEPIKL